MKGMIIRERKADVVKKAFSDALEELMLKKDLVDITINEIIERAGMSRTTFYRYFQDKFELSRWRLENMLGDIDRETIDSDILAMNLKMLVSEIGEHKPYYKKLSSYVGQNSLEDFFYSVLYEWAEHFCAKKGRTLGKKDYYIVQYHASGIIGVMKRWLNENNPIVMEDISDIIVKMGDQMNIKVDQSHHLTDAEVVYLADKRAKGRRWVR